MEDDIKELADLLISSDKIDVDMTRKIQLPSHVHIFNPDEYGDREYKATANKSHIRYNCPYCFEARGKDDKDGKFYWSIDKGVGFCFKCRNVGILSEGIYRDVDIPSLADSFDPNIKLQRLNLSKVFFKLDDKAKEYILDRCKIYELGLPFKLYSSPEGIVFPIIINGNEVSYQIRLYQPYGKMKYFIPEGTKLLYSVDDILLSPERKSVTIVEGPFDALSAKLLGYSNPIAIQGLYLSDVQIELLNNSNIKSLTIALDEKNYSLELYHSIKTKLNNVEEYIIVDTAGMDFEEFFDFGYDKVKDKIETNEDLEKLCYGVKRYLDEKRSFTISRNYLPENLSEVLEDD